MGKVLGLFIICTLVLLSSTAASLTVVVDTEVPQIMLKRRDREG